MAGFAAGSVERPYDTYLVCLTSVAAAAAVAVDVVGIPIAAFLVVYVVVAAGTGRSMAVLAVCLRLSECYLRLPMWCLPPSVAACPSRLADLHLLSRVVSDR